ncbi:MAG: DUF6147 family protein [Eubacteriales bacterium]|nr:DUF6147 family protein [Eubacteriales bacterium]
MKKKKMIWSAVLGLLLGLCLSLSAMAQETSATGTVILQRPSLEGETLSPISPYGTYLSHGSCSLTKAGPGLVYISGSTSCHRVVQTATVAVYLEQLDGTWWTYDSASSTGYSTYEVSVGRYVSVPTGYYYRVEGAHTVTSTSGVYESGTSISDGIYI